NLFRAAALRSILAVKGAATEDVLFGLALNQLEMSTGMLNHDVKDGKIVFKGDLDGGEKFASSARTLFARLNDHFSASLLDAAEARIADYATARRALAANPDRFRIAPVYGPFPMRKASDVKR